MLEPSFFDNGEQGEVRRPGAPHQAAGFARDSPAGGLASRYPSSPISVSCIGAQDLLEKSLQQRGHVPTQKGCVCSRHAPRKDPLSM
jgi:hypothetical protein